MGRSPFRWRGLDFDIGNPDVYPPKPASLLLAEVALQTVRSKQRVLDACTGSGVVGIAVAKFIPDTSVILSDTSGIALAIAKQNAVRNVVTVTTVQSDLYAAFADGEFDVITVHPPAVPYAAGTDWGMSSGMRAATFGGIDGSEIVMRSIAEAHRCLEPRGTFLLLLPHWSNVRRAWAELKKWYVNVREIAVKQVEFFPAIEGSPSREAAEHVRSLANRGVIELDFASKVPLSRVSVIEGTRN